MHTGTRKPPTKKKSPTTFLEIKSEDPEVISMQGMLSALMHFGSRGLTLRHLKIMVAVGMFCKVTKEKTYPTINRIAGLIHREPEDFASEITDLVEKRYLHEVVPTFGECVITYKPGSSGGTLLKLLLKKPKRETVKRDVAVSVVE